MESNAQYLIDFLMKQGADYADIRLYLRNENEYWGTLNGDLDSQGYSQSTGFGVRVLYQGAWGFASSENFTDFQTIGEIALHHAKLASQLTDHTVTLMPKTIHHAEFHNPINSDPFSIPTKEKIEFLLNLDHQLDHHLVQWRGVNAQFSRREIVYFDSEGAKIRKNLLLVNGLFFVTAQDSDGHQQTRTHHLFYDPNSSIGFNTLHDPLLFSGHTSRVINELLQICTAPECKSETCDLIILTNQMALQVHETIGHALELDRILGYELSYAGGSFVALSDFGHLQYGSEKLTVHANGCIPNSPGSFGFDDDGVEAQNIELIKNGLLMNAITSRQMTVEANKRADKILFGHSGGANRASSYKRIPIERMTNINVDPGADGTLQDIISHCENGLMVDTPTSWSIGSNRENFHFACEIGWKIRNGKIDHVVRNPQYRGDTLRFWNSLSEVGDFTTWRLEVVFNCGKGQPNQTMHLGHGIPVCLFKSIQVGHSS